MLCSQKLRPRNVVLSEDGSVSVLKHVKRTLLNSHIIPNTEYNSVYIGCLLPLLKIDVVLVLYLFWCLCNVLFSLIGTVHWAIYWSWFTLMIPPNACCINIYIHPNLNCNMRINIYIYSVIQIYYYHNNIVSIAASIDGFTSTFLFLQCHPFWIVCIVLL